MGCRLDSSGLLWFGLVLGVLGLVRPAVLFQAGGPLEYEVLEELSASTEVGNVITDAKLDKKYNLTDIAKLRFSFLTQPEPDRAFFAIGDNSGIIRTTAQIDRDVICPEMDDCFVKFDVAVRPIRYFQIIKVKVEIVDVNDNAPLFPQERISHQISESALPGTSFGIPAASDPDSARNRIQYYEMKSSSNKFELKTLTTADGATDLRLVLKERLDREEVDFYQVKVVAHDRGLPHKSGSVLIDVTVLDANDNDPKFENETYEVQVVENLPIHTTILKVRALDPDDGVNGQIEYKFTKHTEQSYGDLFGIDSSSGHIFMKGELDFEKGMIYLLSLSAKDKGADSLPAHASVVVRVQDMNDNAPTITVNTLTASGEAHIMENAEEGAFVAHISVIDLDTGINGKFSCSLDNSDFHLQKLYLTEYKIVSAAVFDREREPYIDLFLTCQDKGEPTQTSYEHIRVTILDENDNFPAFVQDMYMATISENNLIDDYILTVTATDYDDGENGNVWYQLEGDAKDKVRIDDTTGRIVANVIFDHEQIQELKFHVMATDGGDPPNKAKATIILKILDVDDEKPHFLEDKYTFSVLEGEPSDTEVDQVLAEDLDSPPFNKFLFSLDPYLSDTDTFKIDPDTGIISSNKVLNRETRPVYNLVVVATSLDNPMESSTASVSIYVADKNDNAPEFDFPTPTNNTVHVSNKAPIGHVLTRLKAHDVDTSDNARLTYLLEKGNDGNIFTIDSWTGAIAVNSELEEISHQQFQLGVAVRDNGNVPLTTSARLYIIVDNTIAFAQTRKWPLSGDNLIIVLIFAGTTFIVCIIIIGTILFVKRRDMKYRHRNQAKDGEAVPGATPEAGQQPGQKLVPTGDRYLSHKDMEKLKKGGSGTVAMNGRMQQRAETPSAEAHLPGESHQYEDLPPPPSNWTSPRRSDLQGSHLHQQGLNERPASTSSNESATYQPIAPNAPANRFRVPWPNMDGGQEVGVPVHRAMDQDSDSGSSANMSNSDSGRGPSSEEGDINPRLSMEALEDNASHHSEFSIPELGRRPKSPSSHLATPHVSTKPKVPIPANQRSVLKSRDQSAAGRPVQGSHLHPHLSLVKQSPKPAYPRPTNPNPSGFRRSSGPVNQRNIGPRQVQNKTPKQTTFSPELQYISYPASADSHENGNEREEEEEGKRAQANPRQVVVRQSPDGAVYSHVLHGPTSIA